VSETENPALTLIRLLKANLRVVKDNGAFANIGVAGEWQNADAFKGYDAQVTVGLAETSDQKLELSGKTRRRTSTLRVNIWVTEQFASNESARTLRNKLTEEISRVIRQTRATPNQTQYDFYALGAASQTHRAFWGTAEAAPQDAGWTELTNEQIVPLWRSDDGRCQVSCSEEGEVAAMLFGFKLENREEAATRVVLLFEGYGTAPSGNGVTVKAWNHESAAWTQAQSGVSGSDQTLTVTLLQDLPRYIGEDGYVWCLAQTTNACDGQTPAVLNCDYAACTVTVKGITYCDLVSYRDVDRVDVTPTIFRTEFTVKSWFFENIGA
jgi:hypothetical protein